MHTMKNAVIGAALCAFYLTVGLLCACCLFVAIGFIKARDFILLPLLLIRLMPHFV